ncbi:FAD-dependent oxidoreductase [Amycolatopsis sp. CA-230715]|uniref:FAD-dependent oxidoreductase n=1 Tax=Amycolatopsis sp. CA-230715 TaxID=2745196 RepID=UPI001C00DDB5|nr:FAD-dependent oxidoreductase [Amycolatopsis sp. CA-230715]QWF83426.1 Aklavinone 12-hydroxylase RdmE [Amycolatopsis sp. CA-230715]
MTEPADLRTAVLVVGGGTTGLSAALFLARQGIDVLLVERHPSTAIMPQARAFNPRTIELYRPLGLEAKIRERTSILAELPEMIGAETLAGEERFRVDVLDQVRPSAGLSPTDWALIDQDELERVLRESAEDNGVDVRFATELVSLDQTADGVRAVVRDLGSGDEYGIRADYLIAADGHRAGIRHRLGIEVDQIGPTRYSAHFLFEADLTVPLRGRRFLLAYLDRPTTGTVLVPMQDFGRWMLASPYDPEGRDSPEDFTEQRCVEMARAAIGDPDLELALVPPVPGWPDKVSHTKNGAWIARRYRAGRVFFAGDAAHVFPPAGSYGASTGIADAHNLAWKLAAVLDGRAGEALLDTYEPERRPVAETTLRTAIQLLTSRQRGDGAESEEIDDLTMIFGYRYGSGAVLTEPSTPDSPVEDPRRPSGRPGLRAPHVWLDRAGEHLSTVDLFDGAFTLLAGQDGAEWRAAAEKAAAAIGVDLRVHHVGAELGDPENCFTDAYGITGTGATLVRPDGFVAWRAKVQPPEPERELRQALTAVLARS